MRITKFAVLSLATMFLVSACGSDTTSQAPLPPPTQPSIAEIQSNYYKVGRVGRIGVTIAYDRARFGKISGQTIYFVANIRTSTSGVANSARIPSQLLRDIPENLAETLADNLTNPAYASTALELAKQVAKRSICIDGTVAPDDRPLKRSAPLTAEQQQRMQAAIGGNPGLLLSMTPDDLARLGLSDILQPAETIRVQVVDYANPRSALPVVYLRCIL